MNRSIASTIDWTNKGFPDIFELAALHLTPVQQVVRIVCCILGIPLNILVAVVIIRSRQLWSPRNIFWLAITLFNSIALIELASELAVHDLYQRSDGSHLLLCEILSTQNGYPYGLVLAGLALASGDRYLTLAHQHFYQKYGTTKNAICVLILTFFIVTGINAFWKKYHFYLKKLIDSTNPTGGGFLPYWTGMYTVECGIRYEWLIVILNFHGLLSSICLAVQTRLFFFIRKCLRYAPAVENIQLESIYRHQTSACSINNDEFPRISARTRERERPAGGKDSRLLKNRLEMRAALILALGILPYCLINLTLCICALAGDMKSSEFATSFLLKFMLTCRELIRLHFIYIPIVFATQSSEFRAAIKRFRRTRNTPSVDELN